MTKKRDWILSLCVVASVIQGTNWIRLGVPGVWIPYRNFCVECKGNVCEQCIVAYPRGGKSKYRNFQYVICNKHTNAAYTRHLPEALKETRWDQLLNEGKNLSKNDIGTAKIGTEVPCYWRVAAEVGEEDDPETSEWWVRSILYKASADEWSIYDEQNNKLHKNISANHPRFGLRNQWQFEFKYPTQKKCVSLETSPPKNNQTKPGKKDKYIEQLYGDAANNSIFHESDNDDYEFDEESMERDDWTGQRRRSTYRSRSGVEGGVTSTRRVKKTQNQSYRRDTRLPQNSFAKTTDDDDEKEDSDSSSDDDSSASSSGVPGSKLQSPNEFMTSLGGLMSEKLNKNNSKTNPYTYSSTDLKKLLNSLVGLKKNLLKGAQDLDDEIDGKSVYDIVQESIPSATLKKEKKESVVARLVRAWSVTQYFVGDEKDQINLSRSDLKIYKPFNDVMSKIERQCHSDIAEVEVDKKYRSLSVPPDEFERRYMEGGARKVSRKCAFCGCLPSMVDEPPSNREKKKNNNKKKKKYQNDARKFDQYRTGSGQPLLDGEGKVLSKLNPPVFEVEVMVCHCHENPDSNCKCAFVCPISEYDDYEQYHTNRKKAESKKRREKLQSANAVLEDCARTRDMSSRAHLSHLVNYQNDGKISSSIPSDKLEADAMKVGFHSQAIDIARRNIGPEALTELSTAVEDFQESFGGPSMTTGHGDMRYFGGTNTPGTQRARNNGLNVTASTKTAIPRTGQSLSVETPIPTPRSNLFQFPQQEEPTPDYIADARRVCDDKVAFESVSAEKQVLLQQVSDDLSHREERTRKLAKRWSEEGRSPENIVEGLTKLKKARNNISMHNI